MARSENGTCSCKLGFTGSRCDDCVKGFSGIVKSGKKMCDICQLGYYMDQNGVCQQGYCNQTGTLEIEKNGACHCKPGFDGDKCDRCAYGYTGELCKNCALSHYMNHGVCQGKFIVSNQFGLFHFYYNCDHCGIVFYRRKLWFNWNQATW